MQPVIILCYWALKKRKIHTESYQPKYIQLLLTFDNIMLVDKECPRKGALF